MGALFTRGAPSCSSRKLWRSVTWDTLVGRVVCAVQSAIMNVARASFARTYYFFIAVWRAKEAECGPINEVLANDSCSHQYKTFITGEGEPIERGGERVFR